MEKDETPTLAKKEIEYYFNKGINALNKKSTSSKGSGVTVTNDEINDTMKVFKSLENRGILLKETIKIITSQEEGFSFFLDH